MRWAGHVVKIEEGRSAFKILIGIPTGKSVSENVVGAFKKDVTFIDHVPFFSNVCTIKAIMMKYS